MGLNYMSTTSSTTGVSSTSQSVFGAAADTNPSASPQALSQSDFLKLLVTQMTSQDPLNPTSSQDLLTQTVQLSTLQSNNTLQTSLTQLQNSQNLVQASSMLGRQVTVQSSATTTDQGVVNGVQMNAGIPMILVNGTAYNLGQVLSISTPASTP